MRKAYVLIAFLLLALPVTARKPGAYFSLTTDKTFAPGEKVTLRLYATEVDTLEFRVYRVNDAEKFFAQLQDVHNFGHYTPKEQIDQPTWLERFHDWKHRIWVAIRNFFRGQFSWRSRAHIREKQGEAKKSRVGSAAVFAQVPLLNSNQLVARWKQEMPPRYFSNSQDVPVDPLKKGVYVVEATDGELRAFTVVIVSDMALVTKTAPGQLVAFAAERGTGKPMADARVHAWSEKNDLAQLTTDENGLAEQKIAAQQSPSFEGTRIIAVHGDDVAVVAPYYFNMSSEPGADWTAYVYTDRPIYKPGHTVHYKAILRRRDGNKYAVPSGESQVTIEDPTGKQLLDKKLTISSAGSVNGDFEIPAGAALGYYQVTVNAAGRGISSSGFHVEEYKKPEYEVHVTPDKSHVLEGDSITATIDAKYYFGEPVANATVKYTVHTMPWWSPYIDRDEPEEGESGGDGGEYGSGNAEEGDYGYDYAGAEQSEQEGKLDADGKLKITIPTRVEDKEWQQGVRYRIEARVMDAANREISGRNNVVATYGSFQVGAHADSYVYKKGDKISLTVVARDLNGKPVQTPVKVEMVRREWYPQQRQTVIDTTSTQTAADGNGSVVLTAEQSGSIWIKVTATTPEKREVHGYAYVWITGNDQSYGWWGGDQRQIRLIADKKQYAVGDTAHVLVMTGVPESWVLITTEGRDIRDKKLVHVSGEQHTVDVPVTDESQPNFFVSATFIRDGHLYQGSRNVKVPAVEQKLNIQITPAKKQFIPGEKASYSILATDWKGKPVSGEFSIGVVDEAIYALSPDSTGDPLDTFFVTTYNRVSTESSFQFYFNGEAGTRKMELAGGTAGGIMYDRRPLAQLKPSTETLVQPKIRKNFPDTALWLADLRTDSSGKATAQLEFPDSLTTWRATVRGASADTKVGMATDRVIVRKNVMVRLVMPRFFRQGDEVTISAIVHNYLTSEKNVQVSMDLKGLDVLTGTTQQIAVPSRGETKADWQVRVRNEHEATLLAKALTNEESDAMELTIPIVPFGVKLPDAKAGALTRDAEETTATITLPGDPQTASPTLDISVSPSIAGSMFTALDYLTSFPYGCTEQTMSGFVPDVVVAQTLRDLKLPEVKITDLDAKMRAGLDRLYDFQHADGGWGWWKDDESQVFMTAYVVSGFGMARSAGVDVRQDVLEKGEAYLRNMLKDHENMRSDLRAYVVYALVANGAGNKEMLDDAWSDRKDMSTQGKAMLGLALHANGDDIRARQLADMLESDVTGSGIEAYWPDHYDYFMEFEFEDSAETTAYAVRLIAKVKPESPVLPKAAFWLVNHRDGGYFWASTKQTAMVIYGLTDYVRVSHELDADFSADVYVNGKPVLTKRFTRADISGAPATLHLDASKLQPGANEIRVKKRGSGRLYWSARGEYYSADKRNFQNNKLSLNITRDYYRLTHQREKDQRITYKLEPLTGELHPGDVIAVKMTVTGGEWRYLMVEDPVASGMEFVLRDEGYEIKDRPDWWDSWFTRKEFHDDHAALFQTYFKDHQTFMYLLKAVNPGKFRVSPASVQPMYQPGVIATTDPLNVEVR